MDTSQVASEQSCLLFGCPAGGVGLRKTGGAVLTGIRTEAHPLGLPWALPWLQLSCRKAALLAAGSLLAMLVAWRLLAACACWLVPTTPF